MPDTTEEELPPLVAPGRPPTSDETMDKLAASPIGQAVGAVGKINDFVQHPIDNIVAPVVGAGVNAFTGGAFAPPMPTEVPGTGSASPPITPQAQAVASPPTFVPPGPQTTSSTDAHTQFTGGQKLDPVIQANAHLSQAAETQALSDKFSIQAETDKRLAEVEQRRAADEARLRQAQEAAAAQRKQVADDYAKKVEDAQKAADAVKLPPEESVGTRIANAIALGLGAFGAGMTHGPNQAAAVIAADRDAKMNAWKAQYQRAKGKVDSAENLYALFRNKGLDEQTAEAMAMKNMNDGYATIVRSQVAQSAAPLTIANGEATIEQIRQNNLANDQKLKQAAQGTVTKTVDDRKVTKTGGDSKEQNELIKAAGEEDNIKRYRENSRSLAQFQSLVAAGATGPALAEWVTGKDGLSKRTMDPEFINLLKERGVLGQSEENLRKKWEGGVAPDLLKTISDGLAAQTYSSRQKAAPAIGHFQRAFRQAGIDPQMVMGGETSGEAASAAGATPATYQGKQ